MPGDAISIAIPKSRLVSIPITVAESGPVSVPVPVVISESVPILESGLLPVSVAIPIPLGVVDGRAHGLPEIPKSGLPRGPFAGMRSRGRSLGDFVADLPALVAMAHPGSDVGVPAHAASTSASVVISAVAAGTCPAGSLSIPVALAAAVSPIAAAIPPTPATTFGVRNPSTEAPKRGVPIGQKRHNGDGQKGDRRPCQSRPHGFSSSVTRFPTR